MAVANFHYITRMSSGFKVYILEGQPNLRSEDRYRHMGNDRVRVPAVVYPVKRKRSHERCLTLEERRERALSRSSGKSVQRAAPAVFSVPQSPTSTWSPTPSPTSPTLPSHVYYAPVMEEPLALIKKPRKEPENTEEKAKSTTPNQIQMRPSVITCTSSVRNPAGRPEVRSSSHSPVTSKCSYDHVVDEHFQRSLGASYQRASSRQLSISVSVDDHFAKALGDKWLQIKSKSSSCSSSSASTPPSSPSVTHSPAYSHSPTQGHKEPSSTSAPTSSRWSVN